jgi:hypothetical protein
MTILIRNTGLDYEQVLDDPIVNAGKGLFHHHTYPFSLDKPKGTQECQRKGS